MTTFDRRTVLMTGGLALANGPLAIARGLKAAPSGSANADPSATPGGPSAFADPSAAQPASASPAGIARAVAGDVSPFFPSTDPELVSGVVGAAHTDLDRVVELVTAHPHLARASVDWGFGDWEAALGAASHMGRRDIAEFLIDHGARPNIFSAAMLGQLAVVRAFVEASPGVQRIPGPHGITLLAHARAGGETAAPVFEYLEKLGDADISPDTVELSDEERKPFVGTYEFSAASNATLEIEDNRGSLSLRREGQPFGRRLFALAESTFYPSGSPSVRILFEASEELPLTLRIIDDEVLLTATRLTG